MLIFEIMLVDTVDTCVQTKPPPKLQCNLLCHVIEKLLIEENKVLCILQVLLKKREKRESDSSSTVVIM